MWSASVQTEAEAGDTQAASSPRPATRKAKLNCCNARLKGMSIVPFLVLMSVICA
jgi:hypothetical protein